MQPFISVIIPTFNEERDLGKLLERLKAYSKSESIEILVADGGSNDLTCSIAEAGEAIVLNAPLKGRAYQMNYAAAKARGRTLYFIHADTMPPKSFFADVMAALNKGYHAGCFRFIFDGGPWLLKINAFCTRFKGLPFRGGDQTLFIDKKLFDSLGGYDETYVIMEEYDLIRRVEREDVFHIIPKNVVVSARKYHDNSYLRVTFANYLAMKMFLRAEEPQKIAVTYRSNLKKLR